MHALRRFIQERMDALGWQNVDLSRHSGLSIQLVGQLLNDDRERLPSIPKDPTLNGLARAFGVSRSTVMVAVFEAMGYDLGDVRNDVDLAAVPSERLLGAIAQRLEVQWPTHADLAPPTTLDSHRPDREHATPSEDAEPRQWAAHSEQTAPQQSAARRDRQREWDERGEGSQDTGSDEPL